MGGVPWEFCGALAGNPGEQECICGPCDPEDECAANCNCDECKPPSMVSSVNSDDDVNKGSEGEQSEQDEQSESNTKINK